MPTSEPAAVRSFLADLDARMAAGRDGDDPDRPLIDADLRDQAAICLEFREAARRWARDVFAGRVAFDGEVERAWIAEGRRLLAQAMKTWQRGLRTVVPGGAEEELASLHLAIDDLDQFLRAWVTPQLAVGPSARVKLDLSDEEVQAVRRKLADLPPPPS